MDSDKSIETLQDAVEEAAKQEREAREEPDTTAYTHKFKKPFTWEGKTYEELTFNWGRLTGADHLEIENELLMRGKTLTTPEFTGDFLVGMAVRACTEKKDDGKRAMNIFAIKSMPLRDFQRICRQARYFLLRAGS